MLQLAKVATPLEAATGLVAQASVPPPGFVPIASVTLLESVVTTLPPASSTLTTGCVPKAIPPVEPDGCVVNASCAAGPTVTLNELLVALVSELLFDVVSV